MLNVINVSKQVSLTIFFKPIKILSIDELRDVVEESVMDLFAESGGEFCMSYKKCGEFYILDGVHYFCKFGGSEEHLEFMGKMIKREILYYLEDKQDKEEVV
jgi:hypothetical protein